MNRFFIFAHCCQYFTYVYLVTSCIQIAICDKNNNPPYFDKALYEAEVTENEEIGHTVITVTAKDKDESSRLRYEITRGNVGGAFAVKEETGAIYVARAIDYEAKTKYKLRLVASDSLNENYTTVNIHIKDVNDNPPMFDRPTYGTQITEEDDRKLPKRFLQVQATDGDRDRKNDIRYFLTGEGVDDQNPAKSNFAINATSGEMYILRPLDRDLPHGQPQWKFKVLAKDDGGNGMVAYADVVLELVDVNDNAPFFSYENYTGNVNENGTRGMIVMTMTATDYDDPNDKRNARLEYSIILNQLNENGVLIFRIDEDTGAISTVVCCLDRETTPEYVIKVTATDGGGLRGTGTATIKINDINDMPPEFTKKEWEVEVDETEGDNIPETPILEVSVNDGDLLETNCFAYKVIDDAFGADKFTMVTNSDGTGSLKIAKPLDFEDLEQRFGFNLTIQVSDHGGETSEPYHLDYANVRVRLRDINDKPEFGKSDIEVTVKEDADIGTSLATFRATDADQGGKSRVSYTIDRSSDRKRQFRIDQNGVVTIQRTLDREEKARHQVNVLATDDGTPPKTATATLTVVVSDINDNAPRFIRDYRPMIMEHSPPHKIEEILATDDDDISEGNGPPYTFRMDPNAPDIIKQLFVVQHDRTGANGDGVAMLFSESPFDREQQKEYLVPIVIKDSGTPPMTGTSTLTVIIGDINDHKMFPGSKIIFVYNFNGDTPPTPIGRVHVEDLDDWDLPDKFFYWENTIAHPNFELDKGTGLIVMKSMTSGGTYLLRFVVYDRVHIQEVGANVSVTVKEIPEEAMFNSGSIRISGISAEDFIRVWNWTEHREVTSKYEKLRDVIASLTTTRIDNVDIFSVMIKEERPPITDVRFSVLRSSYMKESFLNGIVDLNRELIEQAVGINITMVGIDECLIENLNCETSCTNVIMIDKQPVVVNANRTSFVGVNTWVQPKCVCGARDFSVIETCRKRPLPCHNGGTCFESSSRVSCKCLEGFEGPQCQMTTRSFDGRGWAWFSSLKQCENSHLSLEFMTRKPDGLLLYNGPISNPDIGEITVHDFISLELQNGRPRLLIDFGSGTAEVLVYVDERLSDGEWHQVDIFWTRDNVRLVIDNCQRAKVEDSGPPQINRSRCETKKNIPPFKEFLNVNTPLQLGGVHHQYLTDYRWQHQHTREGFDGCIKNVIHNSEMYDMANPGSSASSSPGCKPSEGACQSNSITRHCKHGTCVGTYHSAKCACHPGYFGIRCDKEAISKTFTLNSYIKYALSFEPDPYNTDIQLQFRTRQQNGELFRATCKSGREYFVLEISDKKLCLRFNLNHLQSSGEHELWLSNVQVSDGQWHTVRVLRHGSTASISLDGGGGRRYNELLEYEGQHQLMMIENVTVGGDILYADEDLTTVSNGFHEGCMKDIRLNQRYLPMENGTENAYVLESRNLINKCSSNNPCDGIICPKPFVCFDLWMLHECRCPDGFAITKDGKNCIVVDKCLSDPCLNGGKCVNLPTGKKFYCECPDGFKGSYCASGHQEKDMRLSTVALVAAIFSLLSSLIMRPVNV